MKIKVKIKKGKKHSVILLTIALIALVVTEIIGSLYLSAASVILGLAVAASIVTDMIGDIIGKRKGEGDA
ncbi:hypothetical protein [Bacillus cereus]|uniref:hypothetical protein n=1 Tax=Bacillus cereus TaxID=1396 RepID=UPI000BF6E2F0|nr:hypothetical protein [Bacillus cereus]PFM27588.1 hypothetical protein COJ43_31260 [Bacillus cereus]